MKHYASLVLLLACGGLTAPGQAANNMTFFGTLVEPPSCTINNGGKVEVDFGTQVGVNKVNGENYRKVMGYEITCAPGPHAVGMTLEIIGARADYDSAAVTSDVTDLAIRIEQNGEAFVLNRPSPIIRDRPPTLTAVPVKRLGATLIERPFEATATLRAVYQ